MFKLHPFLSKFEHWLQNNQRNRLSAVFILGCLIALAMPPFIFFPILWLIMPAFVHICDLHFTKNSSPILNKKQKAKQGLLLGFAFAFGFFLANFWWMGSAFLIKGGWLILLMPFAIILLCAFLALFWAIPLTIAGLFWREGWQRIMLLALLVALGEIARAHLFTGFPWNMFGYSLLANEIMAQIIWLVDGYSLTFFAILLFSSPILLFSPTERRKHANFLICTLIFCLFVGQILYGFITLKQNPQQQTATHSNISLALIQPNFPQNEKWNPDFLRHNTNKILDLTDKAASKLKGKKALLIWPEAALPVMLQDQPALIRELQKYLASDMSLLAGSNRYSATEQKDNQPTRLNFTHFDYFNSIFLVKKEGTPQVIYDKKQLVPFGEVLPFKDFFESLDIYDFAWISPFSYGTTQNVYNLGDAGKVMLSICYEIIFSKKHTDIQRADWHLVITNDAWFSRTIGPEQHLFHAKISAIKNGLPVVRVANTGISAVFDAFGREIGRIRQNEDAILILPAIPAKRFF